MATAPSFDLLFLFSSTTVILVISDFCIYGGSTVFMNPPILCASATEITSVCHHTQLLSTCDQGTSLWSSRLLHKHLKVPHLLRHLLSSPKNYLNFHQIKSSSSHLFPEISQHFYLSGLISNATLNLLAAVFNILLTT